MDGIVDREGLHSQQPPRGETRVIDIISYIITNRITIRDTIINYIANNTSWLAAIAIVVKLFIVIVRYLLNSLVDLCMGENDIGFHLVVVFE